MSQDRSLFLDADGARALRLLFRYHQVGICKTYETPSGTEEAKANEGFAIFKIESVDNSKYNDVFNFDPGRFYVNQSNAQQLCGKPV